MDKEVERAQGLQDLTSLTPNPTLIVLSGSDYVHLVPPDVTSFHLTISIRRIPVQ